MASISGVSGSNTTSSLYNSANVISGLASGLDTESMIEGLVKSYQTKIQNLTNKATKLEWKQDAYRGIINKMYAFSNKYTSYSSATNLMSSSFFSSAIKVAALGANKDKVTASGRTESDVKLNSVKQLATAARYNTKSSLKGIDNNFSIAAEEAVKFTDEFDSGALSGSMVLKYGDKTVSVVFDPSKDIIADKVYKTNSDGSYALDENGKRIVQRTRTSAEKAADLQALIEKKLGDNTITLSNGESKKANELIDVKLSGTSISFKDKSTGGNSVYISSASDSVKDTLGLDLEKADEKKPASFTVAGNAKFVDTKDVGQYISGATMNISLDGKVKTIQLPGMKKNYDGGYTMKASDYVKSVQAALDKEYGEGKIKVSNTSGSEDSLKLSFKAPDNSDLIINTDVGKALGIGNTATNYLNTGKTLGELMDKDAWNGLTVAKGEGYIVEKDGKKYDSLGRMVNDKNNLIDKDGNELYAFKINGVTVGNYNKDTKLSTILNDINANKDAGVKVSYSQTTRQFSFVSRDTGSENEIRFDGLAKTIFGNPGESVDTGTKMSSILGEDYNYGDFSNFKVNLKDNFEFSVNVDKDDTIESVTNKINDMLGILHTAGGEPEIKAEYDKNTGSFVFKDAAGKAVDYTLGSGVAADLAKATKQVSGSYTKGQDAIFTVEVNGQELEMTRGSNSANIDGMTLTFKDTFNEDYKAGSGMKLETEAVTFNRSTDSDKIVDAIKSMITDYNEMMAEIKSQYATLPYRDSSGAFKSYEPLSDEDKAGMSESAIQKYEEKAKQGILFNDNNLSTLYQRLNSVFTPGGKDEALLRQMGITWSYSTDGTSAIMLDENKLRDMLDSDPDAVADVFTRSASAGGSSNGIMQSMKVQLDRYAGTTGATKGILIQQAGSPLSSLSLLNNEWQKQIDNIGNEIEKWQDKLSAQVDKYTSMFSKLETLIYQMNSQSSTLAGMMGGGSY